MKLPFWLLTILLPLGLAAKLPPANEKVLNAYRDSLCKMDSTIFNGTDDEKLRANRKFLDVLRKALNTEGAFDYAFDSIKTIGILDAPDGAFRIFNWDMPKDDGTYLYFGLLMINDSKVRGKRAKNTYTIYELE